MKTILLILLSLFCVVTFSIAQLDFSPYPGNNTVCPTPSIYTYSVLYSSSSCSYKWTVTNGSFHVNQSNGPEVSVIWNDETKIGKLKVTETCGGASSSVEKEYVIHSLKGVTPANPRAFTTLAYCSTTPFNIAVDRVNVPNTGGVSPVPLKYADGYEWTLPAGWTSGGIGGTIYSTTEMITIQPTNGCSGGQVSVRAYVEKCLRTFSNSVNINVNRATPNITVTPPSGYAGSGWCQQTGVTFTATPISCYSNYVWSFPSGWKGANGATSPITVTTGNTITLYPTGSEADAGAIVSTINLSCNKALPSSAYNVVYTAPTPSISGSTLVCSGSTTYSLNNSPAGTTVSWSSSSTSLLSINNSTGVATRNGTGSGNVTITANMLGGCRPLATTRIMWVGKPAMPVPAEWTNYILCQASALLRVEDAPHYQGVSVQWTKSGPIMLSSTTGYKTIATSTGMSGTAAANVKFTNTCGSTTFNGPFIDIECYFFSAYPNPSKDELMVSFKEEKVENEFQSQNLSIQTKEINLINDQQQNVYTVRTNEKEVVIPVKNIRNGIYILQVINSNAKYEERIVIDH
jgi:hypothetical protein